MPDDEDQGEQRIGWVVELGGVPIAPDHPLQMDDAVEQFRFYARRPGTFVEIRQVNDMVAELA